MKHITHAIVIRLRVLSGTLMLGVFVFSLFSILTPRPAFARYATLVMDATSGKVLNEVNADTRNYPASLTKMMTLYLVFESLQEGRMRLSDRVVISRHAANQPPSRLGLKPGRTLSVEDAIRALAIKSANDIAAAVAEHMAGSERKFARLMTAKARQLGMSNTTFKNASGLPQRAQMSTARDMAKLARALLMNFPNRYHYFSEPQFTLYGKTYKSHNGLLKTYKGADGIKTGYIHASGFNLVASVKRGDKRLIGVVFGARNAKARNRLMTKLLNRGWTEDNPRTTSLKTILARKTNRPTSRLRKSSRNTVWGVQVGAYRTDKPAFAIARRAVALVPAYLENGDIAVTPLRKKSGRILYRGRVLGITKYQAYKACRVLKKKNVGCMPLKVSKTVEIASIY